MHEGARGLGGVVTFLESAVPGFYFKIVKFTSGPLVSEARKDTKGGRRGSSRTNEGLRAELERVRAAEEAKGRVLRVLGRVTAQESVEGICRAIVEGVREELGFDRVGLFIWDDSIGWFRGTFGTGLDGKTTDERHIVWAIQPQYFRRIQQGATFVRGCIVGEPLPRPGEEGITADLVVLRRGGKIYGVISVDNRMSRRPIPQQELEYLTLFTEVLVNAMEIARARVALKASESRFEQIADLSREWIWETDRTWRYTYSSPAVERLLGYRPEEVLGRKMDEFAPPQLRRPLVASLQEAIERDQRVEALGMRLVRRDGGQVICETFAVPLRDASGTCVGYRGCHRDVTRERRLESELLHAQKLEAIGRLAAGIAHDFNNILTSILGVVELILGELDDGDPIRGDIERIREAGERAVTLTRQLLAFSRSQVRGERIIDLRSEVAQIEEFLRRVIGEEVGLVVKLSRETCRVKADPSEIRQVVLELVVNARDAVLQKGARAGQPAMITVSVGPVELDQDYCRKHLKLGPGRYAMISVADTGIGMDEETLQRVFEPFFSTRSDLRRRGLGLSSVYGLVQNRGGDVMVESVPGKGSIFRIYLPLAAENQGARETGSKERGRPANDSGKGLVLVVEDEAAIRALISRKLKSLGYRVLEAADGRVGLELARSRTAEIKLIISDLVMPGMSGKELVEKLRQMVPGCRVLFISGYSADDTVAGRCIGTQERLIEKPFTLDQLAAAVEEMLQPDA